MTRGEANLVERVVSAHRERGPSGRILPAAAWRDLPAALRVAAAEEAELQRALEAALDPDGLSTTARAVLALIEGAD